MPVATKLFGSELYKAQLYQESLLDPDARSPAGAEGIAQFMPATWEEIIASMGIARAHPREADIAIRAGAYYMSTLRAKWTTWRPEAERMKLAQASYNAGFGSILRAQTVCNGALEWSEIQPCLRTVTGRHAAETTTYIERIWRYWKSWTLG